MVRQRHAIHGTSEIGQITAAIGAIIFPRYAFGGHDIGDGRKALRRQGERVLAQRPRIVAGLIPIHIVVVHQIIVIWRAVGFRHAVAIELLVDRGHARRRRVGTVHVRTAAVTVLGIVVVGSGDRIGIFDLVAVGNGGGAVEAFRVGEEGRMARDERLEIGARAAHDRLVVVVADRVLVGERFEDRSVAGLR